MNAPLPHTLYELQLLPQQPGRQSVFDLFNRTRTYGGRDQLLALFTQPLSHPEQIIRRQRLLTFVGQHLDALTIDVKHAYVVSAENYLLSNLAWISAGSWAGQYRQALWFSRVHAQDFTRLQTGVAALQLILRTLDVKTRWLHTTDQIPDKLAHDSRMLRQFFAQSQVQEAMIDSDSLVATVRADRLFRHEQAAAVRSVLDLFYQLDAYCAIARFTVESGWVYPKFVTSEPAQFDVSGLVHPLLSDTEAVRNDFRMASPQRLTMLTGGNMSGKTTFLKACGITVYLAHLGLPVPARQVRLTFVDALLTSIQLNDDLEADHSHFFSELMRLKDATDALRSGQRVFLIADELFRGTNPQDALSCTHLVLDTLIRQRGSLFLVSSHLPGLSDTYRDRPEVQFACFRTQVTAGQLTFTHTIEPGVAEERSGRLLLEQVAILADL